MSKARSDLVLKTNQAEWFEAFVKSTDEKNNTILYLQALFNKFLPVILGTCQHLNIVDLGIGEETLTSFLIQSLNPQLKVNYFGVEQNRDFVEVAKMKIAPLVSSCRIEHADCFTFDLPLHDARPTIILMSHVLYYAPDVGSFVKSIVNRVEENTIVFFIHAPVGSEHVRMRLRAHSQVTTDVCRIIQESCITHSMNDLFFGSYINFAVDPASCRNLYEFIMQSSLEDLPHHGKIQIQRIQEVTERGKFPIWTSVQAITRNPFYHCIMRKYFIEIMDESCDNGMSNALLAVYQGNVEMVENFINVDSDNFQRLCFSGVINVK